MMINTETLEDLNLQHKLINTGGRYPKGLKKTYQITDEKLSTRVMLEMFRASYQASSNKYNNALSKYDVDTYINDNIYNEPMFNRNFVLVTFPLIDKSKKPLTTRFFRYNPNYKVEDIWIKLRESYNVLDKDNLTFNESLFVLYGFNCELIPDYDIRYSDHPIDKALINTKQGELLQGFFAEDKYKSTNQFLKFSTSNHFIELIKGTKEESVDEKKGRNEKIYKEWLIQSEKYPTKAEAYRAINIKLGLSMTESNIGKIIRKKTR